MAPDSYPRLVPTWEWDTAAGQAIVTTAGVMVAPDGSPFTYNKPDLLNGPFFAAPELAWLKESGILEKAPKLVRA